MQPYTGVILYKYCELQMGKVNCTRYSVRVQQKITMCELTKKKKKENTVFII